MSNEKLQLSPIPRLSAPLGAIEQLRSLIEAGTLKPGDPLPAERKLADLLGVSRPTLREALSALTLLNVIETKHGSGRVVSSLDLTNMSAPLNMILSLSMPNGRNVLAVVEMRAAVESGLARMAATRISDEAIERYGELLAQLHKAPNRKRLLQIDMEMHGIIAEQSGSPLLVWILDSFRDLIALARSRTVQVKGVHEKVATDQDRIYEGLKARDPDLTASAMWDHLWRIASAYREMEAKQS